MSREPPSNSKHGQTREPSEECSRTRNIPLTATKASSFCIATTRSLSFSIYLPLALRLVGERSVVLRAVLIPKEKCSTVSGATCEVIYLYQGETWAIQHDKSASSQQSSRQYSTISQSPRDCACEYKSRLTGHSERERERERESHNEICSLMHLPREVLYRERAHSHC